MLKHNNLIFCDDKIGIVFPIYAGRAPKIVLDFLNRSKFNTDYFYLVGTYGNCDSAICETVPAECKKLGIKIDYMNTVSMVDKEMKADKGTEKKTEEIIKSNNQK